jgi:MoxR-like ATPase
MENTLNPEQAAEVKSTIEKIIENVGKVVVGKREIIELTITALLCEGNVLMEDVPGIGKTLMSKAIARSLGCGFQRIQCTPDLLPSDVTGLQYYNQKSGCFEFRPGPLMTNIVLVDEINRATPRTQSALLEAMQEQQITIDMDTMKLPRPFMLMATQNPIELEGTFPLPEAQLDRFLLRLHLGYPQEDEENTILSRFQQENPLDKLTPVTGVNELAKLQALCRLVYCDQTMREYVVRIVRSTRKHSDLKLGASPRAALGLHQAAQTLAAIRGRTYVIPDDVKYLAVPSLAHRIIAKTESRLRGHSTQEIISGILEKTPVPVEETR